MPTTRVIPPFTQDTSLFEKHLPLQTKNVEMLLESLYFGLEEMDKFSEKFLTKRERFPRSNENYQQNSTL